MLLIEHRVLANKRGIQHKQVAFGRTPAGYWYSASRSPQASTAAHTLMRQFNLPKAHSQSSRFPSAAHRPGIKISIADKALKTRLPAHCGGHTAWDSAWTHPAGEIVLVTPAGANIGGTGRSTWARKTQ